MDTTFSALMVILFLVLFNGFFSLSEMATVSANRNRLKVAFQAGSKRAKTVLGFIDKPTIFLSTVQTGMTCIAVLLGMFGEATLTDKLNSVFANIPSLSGHVENLSRTIVVIGITFATLLFGELVPKTLALNNPEKISMAIAVPLRVFTLIFIPFVKALSVITELILKPFKLKHTGRAMVDSEEILILAREGLEQGILKEMQSEFIENAVDLEQMTVREIMTPRTDILYLDIMKIFGDMRHEIMRLSGISYIPICDGTLDEIIGTVKTRDIILSLADGTFSDIAAHIREPFFVPESMKIIRLLETFRKKGISMTFVMDEYGGTIGLVTIGDMIRQFFGRLPGELDDDSPGMNMREDGSWLVDGSFPLDCFADKLSIRVPDDIIYVTVAGYILSNIGKIPKTGDRFAFSDGFEYEIVDMDGRKIDKIIVSRKVKDT